MVELKLGRKAKTFGFFFRSFLRLVHKQDGGADSQYY